MVEQNDNIRVGGTLSPLRPTRTHTYANNTPFYATIPQPYQQYYLRHVRNYFQWYDGYVDWFHNSQAGVFSTRTAYTLLSKLSRKVIGKSLLFDDEGKEDTKTINYKGKELNSLQFISKLAKVDKWSEKAKLLTEWGMAGGDSILKLDSYGKDLSVGVIRKDNYHLNVGLNEEITYVKMLIQTYQEMIKNTDNTELFYLLEERKIEDGVPMWRLNIKYGQGHALTGRSVDFTSPEDKDFRDVPKHIRAKLVKEYPNITFGEWNKLPYKDLGVYMYKATEAVSFIPAMAGGESLLSGILHLLMCYDFAYSAMNTDLYQGRGKLLIPAQQQNPNDNSDYGEHYRGFDSSFMTMIPYVSPEDQKPMQIQFELRTDDWSAVRNHIFQLIAQNIGVAERTIASYLVPASEKPSAYEIGSEEQLTTSFVERHREELECVWNSLIENVLHYYNFDEEEVFVKFSKVGLTNISNIINQITILRQNGLIDLRTALEEIFLDKTEKQIQTMYDEINKEMETKAQLKQSYTDPLESANENIKAQSTLRQTKDENTSKPIE